MRHILLTALSLYLLCILVLGSATPARAKSYNMDITCDAFIALPNEATGLFSHWLAGWWGARNNDLKINALRVQLLTESLASHCQRNMKGRILDAARALPSMPPAPDHALNYTCKQFLNSGLGWETMHTLWLQGYQAYKNNSTIMHDTVVATRGKYEAICERNWEMTMGEVIGLAGTKAGGKDNARDARENKSDKAPKANKERPASQEPKSFMN